MKSGPSRQTIDPSRPTMASRLASRLLMITLFGAKRLSPSSNHRFGPTYVAELMCSQSKLPRAALNPDAALIAFLASARKPELVDVVARHPVPDDVTVPRHLDQSVVFEQHIGDRRLLSVRVGQNQRVAAFDGGRALG